MISRFALLIFCAAFLFSSIGSAEEVALEKDEKAEKAEKAKPASTPVPREGGQVVVDDDAIYQQLEKEGTALIESNKVVPYKELLEQLKAAPHHVDLKISAQIFSGTAMPRLYDTCQGGVLIIAGIYKCKECGKYHPSAAGGFILTEGGIAVTNYHVVDDEENLALLAMTSDHRIVQIKTVLAASKKNDIAILQLDGKGFTPLPLTTGAMVGSDVFAISHPDERFYSLTRGILSRRALLNHYEDEDPVPALEITADYASGSSGCPVFNAAGQVIGMVSSTTSAYSNGDNDPQRDLQMVFKECVPSEQILEMVSEGK